MGGTRAQTHLTFAALSLALFRVIFAAFRVLFAAFRVIFAQHAAQHFASDSASCLPHFAQNASKLPNSPQHV
eukprot:1514503-Rhodomonas_salina.1